MLLNLYTHGKVPRCKRSGAIRIRETDIQLPQVVRDLTNMESLMYLFSASYETVTLDKLSVCLFLFHTLVLSWRLIQRGNDGLSILPWKVGLVF